MTSDQMKALADRCPDTTFRRAFRVLKGARCVGDNQFVHTSADIERLGYVLYEQVQASHVSRGREFQDVPTAQHNMVLKIAGDMYNTMSGIGTMSDPTSYTRSAIPIMMGPMECTELYAAGGLAASILDKKTGGLTAPGLTFKAFEDTPWSPDKITALEEAVAATGLVAALEDAIRDAYIYGGSLIYPVFQDDSYISFIRDLDTLSLERGCIKRWVNVDRWNMTWVPSYDVTAEDYLRPKSAYIPLGGYEVSTSRCAILKPKPQPYWSALCNIGWSPSDFSGWIRSLMGYQITVQAIPVMAQQMSLLLYRIPMDELNATLGSDAVRRLMEINEEKMREWSAVNPKAISMIGEVTAVERTYSGFDQFLGGMKSDLAAQCGIPEPSIWHTPNKGFSDNTQESLMKESSTLNRNGQYIERSLRYITDALVAHVFGKDSEEWNQRRRLWATFDKPAVSTETDLAEIAARYAAAVASLTQAGVPPDVALTLNQQFFPTVKMSEDMIADIRTNYEKVRTPTMSGGQGHSLASAGTAGKVNIK